MDVADLQYLRYANICHSNNIHIYESIYTQYMYTLENGVLHCVLASIYINDDI